jgi:hypothetical protein
MGTVIAQTRKVSGYFVRVAQRLYDARLASADREVGRHRQFLGLVPF